MDENAEVKDLKFIMTKHVVEIKTVEEDALENDEQITSENLEYSLNGNKCHLCTKQMKTREDFDNHIERYREDFIIELL